ncbi:hypothetical protein M885DRAFT_521136 [Pelagophyceae sp. CCMP2097]|nr:hypothetical protein M885DRAFT_521136 [Pelagophyceae sp. CCMP2097]
MKGDVEAAKAVPFNGVLARPMVVFGGESLSDRHRRFASELSWMELSGMLGDLGTLVPLVIGMANAGAVDAGPALFWMGIFNIVTAYTWDMPLPVQPMKTIAAVAITDGLTKGEAAAAGIFVGGVVMILGATRLVEAVNAIVPRGVVSGVQIGLGVRMAAAGVVMVVDLGWREYPDGAVIGLVAYMCAAAALASDRVAHTDKRRRKIPVAVALVAAGIVLALLGKGNVIARWRPGRLDLSPRAPKGHEWRRGIWRAGFAQLPLTLLNSVVAVTSLAEHLFADRYAAESRRADVPTRVGISTSVGAMNVICCFFGGMPACHGSGGLAGQYHFGARGGAAVLVLGVFKCGFAVLLGDALINSALAAFPKCILGVLLGLAGLELARAGVKSGGADAACAPALATTIVTIALANTGLGAAAGVATALAEKVGDFLFTTNVPAAAADHDRGPQDDDDEAEAKDGDALFTDDESAAARDVRTTVEQ